MKRSTINELNAFLKGEHMAIDAYEKYLRKINTPYIKSEFEQIKDDHEHHAVLLSERIELLGGKPARGVGFTGKVAEVMSSVKGIGKTDEKFIIKDAYHGEDLGIEMAEEIIKGDLDEKSNKLIDEILEKDRNHLDTLKSLMG